jgi:hypothetical protein
MFRKIAGILGILSLVAVLAAGGAAAWLAARGTLNRESLKTAVSAVTSRPAAAPDGSPPAAPTSGPAPADKLLALGHENEAATMGELEMFRRQVGNERAMVEAARLEVQREREKMDQQRKQWEASRQKDLESSQQSGVRKEMEILSSIKPAQALSVLRGKSDPEAARTVMAMETRKAKKIIELCKTTEEVQWRKRILELIREQNNVQAAALAGG